MVRSTRRRVTMASAMKREGGDHVKDEEIDDLEADGEDEALCVVCTTANARVTVTCAACAKTYHLVCHSPPLRRRPVSEATWECSQCGLDTQETTPSTVGAKPARSGKAKAVQNVVQDEKVEVAVKTENGVAARKRRRGAVDAAPPATDEKHGEEEDDEKDLFETIGRQAKTRRSTKAAVATITTAQLDADDAMVSGDAVARSMVDGKPVKQRVGKLRAPSAKPPGKRAPRAPIKVQEVELASKRTSRVATRKRLGSGGVIKPHRYIPEEEEEEEAEDDGGGGDDDNDSDFSGSEADKEEDEEEEEDDDDEEEDASDEDFEKPVKRPARKSPLPKPRNNKVGTNKPTKQAPKRKPAPNKAKKSKQDATADGHGDGDDSSSAIAPGDAVAPLDIDSDDGIEDEVYTGPSYFVEYAPNARASCKSCEQKLAKESLRVGVKVKHSMFGITTYFKHVECTQICVAACSDDDDAPLGGDPIRGLSSLKPKDKAFVLSHMRKNTELGLLDERRELSEDQYVRKTRMPEKEPSPLLTATLLPYQREALAWMAAQEQGEYKGGILADEMGMGKTIQAISLILENPRDDGAPPVVAAPPQTKKGKSRSQKVEFKTSVRGGTLVVCPLVAVMQWKSEIERFVESNHFSIYIHHGPKRLDLVEKIAAYDIVLTTYSIIESESRKTLGWEKVPCKYCKKKYLPDKLILHNKYFCGPNAKKTALQDRQQTKKKGKKAAGDASSDDDEDDDLKKPVKAKKKPAAKKKTKKKKIESDDESDDDDDDMAAKPQRKAATGKSPMHQIHWTRIVLDEAHYIKDRRCNTARGVFELKSDYRWCLTGTPLQNRIGELFSLVRFLQIKHYAYYHCNKCECQKLDFDFPDGKCQQCDHPAMQHFSFFNKKIVVPIQSYGYVAEGKVAMLRLQNELLQHILLRRTKEGRADDISLPPKLVRVRRDRLDERENDFYQAIYTQSQAQFNTYVSSGTLLNNYAHIFDLLIRLRQAVDHPYLVIYSKSNPALQVPVSLDSSEAKFVRPVVKENALISVVDDDHDALAAPECVICHEDAENPVAASCSHHFCRECVKEFIESLPDGASATCPDCEKPLTVDLSPPKSSTEQDEEDEFVDPHKPVIHRAIVDLKRYSKHSILHRISDLDSFQTSTKIEALMQELEHMKIRDPSGKAIIFSQFVNMLDIIQHRLTIGGIKCVKLSGNMTMDLRDRTIRAFREDNSITVFLISLKAGGVALNLTIASHIFLMDPWWNPAAENQAIDRTHRLGQFKPVEATRFIIAGTIEERILKLQEKKRLIFEGTVGGSVSAICRLTEDDLRFLFSK